MKASLYLRDAQQAHKAMLELWATLKPWLIAGHRFELTVKPERRSSEQNSRMWAMLNDVAEQVEWHGQKLDAESWKHMFSAALNKQKAVPGIDGGFVVLGSSTSRMTKAELSELIDLIDAFGAQHNVFFKDMEHA